MRKDKKKKLTLRTQTVQQLTSVALTQVQGGYPNTAINCTAKQSGCHECPE